MNDLRRSAPESRPVQCVSQIVSPGRLRALALILLTTAVAYDSRIDGNLDFVHEGERLGAYDALMDGRLPYRDIHIPHGLGEDVVKPLLASRLFGPSIESLRRVGLNAYRYRGVMPALAVAAALVAAAVTTRTLTARLVHAALVLTTWYEMTDRQLLGFLAVACLAMFARHPRRAWLAAAGGLSVLASLYSLEVGIYAATAGVAWLVLDAMLPNTSHVRACSIRVTSSIVERLGCLAVGALVAALPFLAWGAWLGIVDDFFHDAYLLLFLHGEASPLPYPSLFDAAEHATPGWRIEMAAIYYAIPAAYVAVVAGFVIGLIGQRTGRMSARTGTEPSGATSPRDEARFEPRCAIATDGATTAPSGSTACDASRLLLAALFAATFWSSVIGRPEPWHVAAAIPAFSLFTAVAVDVAVLRREGRGLVRKGSLGMAALAMVAVVAGLVWYGQGGAIGRRFFSQESRFLPPSLMEHDRELIETGHPRIGRVRIDRTQAYFVSLLLQRLDELSAPGDDLLDLADMGLLHFLSGRRNPTRFLQRSEAGASPRLQALMLGEVQSRPRLPPAIIRWQRPPGEPPPDVLESFVDQHYVRHATVGPYEILRPNG